MRAPNAGRCDVTAKRLCGSVLVTKDGKARCRLQKSHEGDHLGADLQTWPNRARVVESRARADIATTAARVDFIASRMRRGEWARGKTAKELAAEWSISVSRVEDLSAEAWRRVCAEATDADRAKPTISGTLQIALAEAFHDGQYRAVAQLADVYSRVVGARAPEVRAEVPLTEEQARAKYKELTGHDWAEEEKKP